TSLTLPCRIVEDPANPLPMRGSKGRATSERGPISPLRRGRLRIQLLTRCRGRSHGLAQPPALRTTCAERPYHGMALAFQGVVSPGSLRVGVGHCSLEYSPTWGGVRWPRRRI